MTEAEANFFASNILAPRMAIHYARCKNEADVARIFEVSCEAAQYAFDDYSGGEGILYPDGTV